MEPVRTSCHFSQPPGQGTEAGGSHSIPYSDIVGRETNLLRFGIDKVARHGLTRKKFFHGNDMESGMSLKGCNVIKVGEGELILLSVSDL